MYKRYIWYIYMNKMESMNYNIYSIILLYIYES